MEPIEHIEKRTPEEQAEIAAYRDAATQLLYVPGIALQRCLVRGAAYSKGKGRSSLQKSAAACLLIAEEKLSLGTQDFVVDARPVVIAATKGRIIRYRPRIDAWKVSFSLEFDPALLKESECRRIVDDSGTRVGLLDFRPERNGPFGRFVVVNWSKEKGG
jgi:hypothetical protein